MTLDASFLRSCTSFSLALTRPSACSFSPSVCNLHCKRQGSIHIDFRKVDTITLIFRTLVHQRSNSIFFVEQISPADMLLLGSICTSVAPAAALAQRQEALRPSGFYLFLWQSRRIKIRGTLFLLWDRSRQLFLSSLSADQMLRGAATP